MCLCEYHENVRLIIKVIPWLPNTTTELVKILVCNELEEKCMFQDKCKNCKNLKLLDDIINKNHPDPGSSSSKTVSEYVVYEQWGKTHKDSYENTLEHVVKLLQNQLKYFLFHVFVKRNQVKMWDAKKSNPGPNTLLVHMDFPENYVHITQDEILKSFFNQCSSTVFTTSQYLQSGK